jgi:hypothetical protein
MVGLKLQSLSKLTFFSCILHSLLVSVEDDSAYFCKAHTRYQRTSAKFLHRCHPGHSSPQPPLFLGPLPSRLTGSKIKKICDLAHITLDKNVCCSFGSPSLVALPPSLVSSCHLIDRLSLRLECRSNLTHHGFWGTVLGTLKLDTRWALG